MQRFYRFTPAPIVTPIWYTGILWYTDFSTPADPVASQVGGETIEPVARPEPPPTRVGGEAVEAVASAYPAGSPIRGAALIGSSHSIQ